MKRLKYQQLERVNHGTEEQPDIREHFTTVEMGWNQVNEEIAKREAYNGEYTVEDDGRPEPEQTPEERIAELEEALELLLSGVTQ